MILMVMLFTVALGSFQGPVYDITIKAEGFKTPPRVAPPQPQRIEAPTIAPLRPKLPEPITPSKTKEPAQVQPKSQNPPGTAGDNEVSVPKRPRMEENRSVAAHHFTPIVKRRRMPAVPKENVKPVDTPVVEEANAAAEPKQPPKPAAPPVKQNVSNSKEESSVNAPVSKEKKIIRVPVAKPKKTFRVPVAAKPNDSVPAAKPTASAPVLKPDVSPQVSKPVVAAKPNVSAPVKKPLVAKPPPTRIKPVPKPNVTASTARDLSAQEDKPTDEKPLIAKPSPVRLKPLPKPNDVSSTTSGQSAKEEKRTQPKVPKEPKQSPKPKEVQEKTSADAVPKDPQPQIIVRKLSDEVVVHSKNDNDAREKPTPVVPTKEIKHQKPKSAPTTQKEEPEMDVTSNSSSVQEALDAKHKAEEAIAKAAAKWQGKTITHQRKKKEDEPIKLKPVKEIKQIKHRKD